MVYKMSEQDAAREFLERVEVEAKEYMKAQEISRNNKVKCYHEHGGHCCFSVGRFWWFLAMPCMWGDFAQCLCMAYSPVADTRED